MQVIINTTHLEQSCHFLEEFISNITNVPPDSANATKLYGTSTFKVRPPSPLVVCPSFLFCALPHFFFFVPWPFVQDARHAAEAEIYTNLNAKIDQFLQLANYDWMAAAPGGGALEASDYLVDLIAFLKSTFSVFTNLPVSTR